MHTLFTVLWIVFGALLINLAKTDRSIFVAAFFLGIVILGITSSGFGIVYKSWDVTPDCKYQTFLFEEQAYTKLKYSGKIYEFVWPAEDIEKVKQLKVTLDNGYSFFGLQTSTKLSVQSL